MIALLYIANIHPAHIEPPCLSSLFVALSTNIMRAHFVYRVGSSRLIADMVGKAGIQDMTGYAGTGENIQGEEQKKLDILSNDVFKDKLAKTGLMAFLGACRHAACAWVIPVDSHRANLATLGKGQSQNWF